VGAGIVVPGAVILAQQLFVFGDLLAQKPRLIVARHADAFKELWVTTMAVPLAAGDAWR